MHRNAELSLPCGPCGRGCGCVVSVSHAVGTCKCRSGGQFQLCLILRVVCVYVCVFVYVCVCVGMCACVGACVGGYCGDGDDAFFAVTAANAPFVTPSLAHVSRVEPEGRMAFNWTHSINPQFVVFRVNGYLWSGPVDVKAVGEHAVCLRPTSLGTPTRTSGCGIGSYTCRISVHALMLNVVELFGDCGRWQWAPCLRQRWCCESACKHTRCTVQR